MISTNEIDAGMYQAVISGDGRIEVWDGDDRLFILPIGFPAGHVLNACLVYEIGRKRGEQYGRSAQQRDIRKALGLIGG